MFLQDDKPVVYVRGDLKTKKLCSGWKRNANNFWVVSQIEKRQNQVSKGTDYKSL